MPRLDPRRKVRGNSPAHYRSDHRRSSPLNALVGVGAYRDNEVGDVAVEQRLRIAVLSIPGAPAVGWRFGSFAATIDIAMVAKEFIGGACGIALFFLTPRAAAGLLLPDA